MEALFSAIASFALFHFTTHPKSRLNKRLPKTKFSRIQLLPHISVEAKNRVFHFHHWMLFTPAYIISQNFDKGILNSGILHGFLLGGIVQGLMYKDRLRLVHKANEFHKVKRSRYHIPLLKRLKKIVD